MDKILDFNQRYDPYNFKWTESDLYHLLCDYYGVCDVLLETCYGMVLVKKYNVVGYTTGDAYINVYESIGELDKLLWRVSLDSIYCVEVLF